MAYVSCDWYYENILGDNCDVICDKCFGDKDVYICKKDFEVVGDLLETVTIEKDSWFALIFLNHDHALLSNLIGRDLYLKRDLFDLYFESFEHEEDE
jgi:hypothetical protein